MATIIYTLETAFNVKEPNKDVSDTPATGEPASDAPAIPEVTQEEFLQRVADKQHFTYDQMKGIFDAFNRALREVLWLGDNANIKMFQFNPRMRGRFAETHGKFNPKAHKRIIDISPTDELLDAIKKGGAKILGIDPSEIYISKIIRDIETGTVYIHLSND
jgi:nucleoid DNA-binding protein